MPDEIQNQLCAIRRSRGISAAELARRTGVTRQTIYAIESGVYVPNTAVSLRLASTLAVTVEEIFRLPEVKAAPEPTLRAEILASSPPPAGTPLRLCEVGFATIAVPAGAEPYFLRDADAILMKAAGNRRALETLPFAERRSQRLVIAGCDPALGLLGVQLQREEGFELVTAPAASAQALEWLRKGKVHIAGTHLRDSKSGEFNLPYLKRKFAGEDLLVVTFAQWEEGLVTAPGNPRGIRKVADLVQQGLRFMNREPGSGSRLLFERLIADEGISAKRISGSDRLAAGHLAAAYAVARGEADSCIATRSAAQAFGLGFVALQQERFDLVLRRQDASLPGMQALLGVLQKASFRRRLECHAGYETRHSGAQLG
jgi:putative molybdopterin biosynthesis protein